MHVFPLTCSASYPSRSVFLKLFTLLYLHHARIHLVSYPFVSAPKVVQPISVLGGTTGGYRRGLRCDSSKERPWKQPVSNKQWRLLSIDAVIASVISELETISSLMDGQRATLKMFLLVLWSGLASAQ